jgi:hypothetical protein
MNVSPCPSQAILQCLHPEIPEWWGACAILAEMLPTFMEVATLKMGWGLYLLYKKIYFAWLRFINAIRNTGILSK